VLHGFARLYEEGVVVYFIDYSKFYFKKLDKLQKEQPDNLASRLALQY